MVPKMLSECIGKKVSIYIEGGLGGYVATVLAVEDNFIKIEDKKNIRYINADMIIEIRVVKEQSQFESNRRGNNTRRLFYPSSRFLRSPETR